VSLQCIKYADGSASEPGGIKAFVITANELIAYPSARAYPFICALQDYDQTPNLAPGQRLSHRATVMEHGRHSSSRQIARANREASENVHRFCP